MAISHHPRLPATLLSAALSIIFGSCVAGIIVWLRVTDENALPSSGVAAAVINFASVATIISALAFLAIGFSQVFLAAAKVLSILLYLVGTVLSLRFLIHSLRLPSNTHTVDACKAAIALWALNTITQVVFFVCLPWHPTEATHHSGKSPYSRRYSEFGPMGQEKSPNLTSLSLPHPSPPTDPSSQRVDSPQLSPFVDSPGSSIRDSLQNVIKPVTAKARLIHHSIRSSNGRSSLVGRPVSLDTERNDGFESWDTSDVQSMRSEEADAAPAATTRPQRLATIAGSRPPSPARPLDGPFALDDPLMHEPPLPESVIRAISPTATSPYEHTTRERSSTLRSTSSQTHIHPLFRPESPMPPPLASPGTVIVASPLAGQVVRPDDTFMPRLISSAQSLRTQSRAGTPVAFEHGHVPTE